jgi:HEAT repeat protein
VEASAVLPFIGRLKEESRVRALALDVLQGREPESIQAATELLQQPAGLLWSERITAAWALGHAALDTAQADAANAALLDTLEDRNAHRLWLRGVSRAYLLALPAAIVGFFRMLTEDGYWGGPPLPAVFIMMVIAIGTMILPFVGTASITHDLLGRARLRAQAARSLGKRRSPESVGALAQALFDSNARVRYAAADALHHVLPVLTHEHYGLFGVETMNHLGRALSHPDPRLVTAVLNALERVGTSAAIPAVERVARRGRTVLLRDRAHEVLAVLAERRDREGQRDRLLRPTVSPEEPSAVLLRVAREAEADPRTLLRPTGNVE